MLFAGLYETWFPKPNQPEVTFTIPEKAQTQQTEWWSEMDSNSRSR